MAMVAVRSLYLVPVERVWRWVGVNAGSRWEASKPEFVTCCGSFRSGPSFIHLPKSGDEIHSGSTRVHKSCA